MTTKGSECQKFNCTYGFNYSVLVTLQTKQSFNHLKNRVEGCGIIEWNLLNLHFLMYNANLTVHIHFDFFLCSTLRRSFAHIACFHSLGKVVRLNAHIVCPMLKVAIRQQKNPNARNSIAFPSDLARIVLLIWGSMKSGYGFCGHTVFFSYLFSDFFLQPFHCSVPVILKPFFFINMFSKWFCATRDLFPATALQSIRNGLLGLLWLCLN